LIREAIQSNPNLVVLKLPYNNIGDDGASLIATAVCIEVGKQHRKLSILDLSFNRVGDTGCGSIALHCIAGNINLQSLCLTGNQFASDGVSALAASISHGTGLRNLYLSVNNVGPSGIKDVAAAVTKNESRIYQLLANGTVDSNTVRPTEELHLDNTAMLSDGLSAISLMVLFNSSLRTLSLCSNNLDDQDLMLLSQAIAQNNKQMPLESLLLSFNQITCLGVECLMNAVWGSTTLREVKLDNNKINDRGIQLSAVVLTSIDLQSLDLSFNKATAVGVKALMKALAENSSLQSLAISGIPIDLISSKAISYALAYNTSLKALYLDSCSTGFASQRHVVAGALSNAKSSLRILTGFCISRTSLLLIDHVSFCKKYFLTDIPNLSIVLIQKLQ
jgi:Ran GTPase-activating protein (RanGAP) involved in mRNA processing and transport